MAAREGGVKVGRGPSTVLPQTCSPKAEVDGDPQNKAGQGLDAPLLCVRSQDP